MSARVPSMLRRRVVLAAALAIVVPVARAQDPRATLVQQAARDWLAINDRNDFAASWQAAGARFRAALDVARWSAAAQKERTPLGAAQQRTVMRTSFTDKVQGAPDGEYALVSFRTQFANKPDGGEQVTLQREGDGAWRVVGYLIL